jgi:hypothetical protein
MFGEDFLILTSRVSTATAAFSPRIFSPHFPRWAPDILSHDLVFVSQESFGFGNQFMSNHLFLD